MRLFLVGFGVVGRSFVELLEARRAEWYTAYGLSPRLVGVADSKGTAVSERGLDGELLLAARESHGTVGGMPDYGILNGNAASQIADSDADVVIQATPTDVERPQQAIDHIKAAFRTGKHVISVNKGPLAVALPALRELADYNRVALRYSGTVGGGTPMLAMAHECARGDEVMRIRGVLNGTANYVLWRMQEDGISFDEALAEAQRLGYAEADPGADVDGVDAATKVVILGNDVLGMHVAIGDVETEGIRGVSAERIASAKKTGKIVRLIGEIAPGSKCRVSAQEVDAGGPLDVAANLNALAITLRRGGDVTLIGRGAGGVETATSVVRDMLDIWQVMGAD